MIDARDPLTYRSTDLEDYARDINASKASLLLLNKSDLLPLGARTAWADYLDAQVALRPTSHSCSLLLPP